MWWWPWRGRSTPEVEAALARVPIFSTLTRRDLRRLASKCLLRHYRAGEPMLEEGSIGLGMFVITGGRVEVFKTSDGGQLPLAVLGTGDVLGEMALLDDQPRSASAVALDATECLLLSRDRFRSLVRRRPRIAWPIVPTLAGRVRDLQAQLLEAERHAPEPAPPGVLVAAPAAAPNPAPVVALEDGPVLEIAEPVPEPVAAPAAGDGAGLDVLRAPYALARTGAVGFGESVRTFEIFLRSLDESSGLASGRPMGDVLRALPASFAAASLSSWDHGRRLPSRLVRTFRDHLRSDWRDEDPG